ncbi:hypothetical protein AA15669_1517 [Saccharibacter floricola DSM 15669]|uniref:Uncharacterized protein n=1 Tax=Saccharibacter floricola DSM 15669 TaxID=1123227 RepID=A0ABQ0NZZ9_9PROT|nr:hypothetical protein AA15669_1517 [Saccharibacter floricola DSM 15669]
MNMIQSVFSDHIEFFWELLIEAVRPKKNALAKTAETDDVRYFLASSQNAVRHVTPLPSECNL